MSIRTLSLVAVAAIAFAAISANAQTAAALPYQPWPPAKWPSSLTDPKLQERLAQTNFTSEEKRNLLTVLAGMSDGARAAQLANPSPQPAIAPLRRGFDFLYQLYGSVGYDFATSIPDRIDRIEDILAKGDRVWGVFRIIGHHNGPMLGFQGDGKPVEFREMFFRRFAPDGRAVESTFRAEELQIYAGLGGKVSFPNPPASDTAPATVVHAMREPAVRKAARSSWPPPEWPGTVKDAKLVKVLTETNWTAEEKTNLQATMEGLVFRRPDSAAYAPCSFSPAMKRCAFDGLNELAGFRGYNAALSVPDRANEIEDIMAKGNQVWTVFVARGHHMGDFFGFPGDGKAIEWREFSNAEFDKSGNRVGGLTRAEELQLYVALGGKTEFPRN